jgi:cysteine-S-conjugate beta-lyase
VYNADVMHFWTRRDRQAIDPDMSKDMTRRAKKPATQAVTGGRRPEWTGPIVNPAVWRASTILYDDVASLKRGGSSNSDGAFFYGRRGTPTQWALAEALTEMEPGAEGTILYSSGVAAVTGALLSVLKPGDTVLMLDSAYDPTRNFCDGFLKDFGVTTTYYDPMIGGDIAALMTAQTRAVFMESPGSHSFEVQDVPAIVAAAKARGVATIIDNTWATPLYFSAIAHGVDLSVIAGTKYIVGHSDAMIGSVTANAAYYSKLRKTAQALGAHVGPDDAWLALRGLRTLPVRLQQHQASALKIAHWLKARPEISRVLHPALPDCPGHALWKRDFRGSTGLFSIILNGGTEAARDAVIDALHYFGIGYSWGGFESLAIPSDPGKWRSATKWEAAGPGIRLQIGLEDPDDLIADLTQALEAFVW